MKNKNMNLSDVNSAEEAKRREAESHREFIAALQKKNYVKKVEDMTDEEKAEIDEQKRREKAAAEHTEYVKALQRKKEEEAAKKQATKQQEDSDNEPEFTKIRNESLSFKRVFSGYDMNEVTEYIARQEQNFRNSCAMYDEKIDQFKSNIMMLNCEKDKKRDEIEQLNRRIDELSGKIFEIMALSPEAFAAAKQNFDGKNLPDCSNIEVVAVSNEYEQKFTEAQQSVENIKNELQKAQKQIDELKAENEKLKSDISEGIIAVDGDTAELAKKLREAEDDQLRKNAEIGKLSDKLQAVVSENDKLRDENASVKQQADEIEKLTDQLDIYAKSISEAQDELISKNEQCESLMSDNKKLKNKFAETEKALAEADNKNIDYENRAVEYVKQAAEYEKQIRASKDNITALTAKINSYEEQLAQTQQIKTQLSTAKQQAKSFSNQLAQRDEDIKNKSKLIDDLSEKLKMLSNVGDKLKMMYNNVETLKKQTEEYKKSAAEAVNNADIAKLKVDELTKNGDLLKIRVKELEAAKKEFEAEALKYKTAAWNLKQANDKIGQSFVQEKKQLQDDLEQKIAKLQKTEKLASVLKQQLDNVNARLGETESMLKAADEQITALNERIKLQNDTIKEKNKKIVELSQNKGISDGEGLDSDDISRQLQAMMDELDVKDENESGDSDANESNLDEDQLKTARENLKKLGRLSHRAVTDNKKG